MVAGVYRSGSPGVERLAIHRGYDLESHKDMAKQAAGITL